MVSFGTVQLGIRHVLVITFVILSLLLLLTDFKNNIKYFKSYYDVAIVKTLKESFQNFGYSFNNNLEEINCTAGVPCVYEDEVDLRIIVITHDRKTSVMKLLESLQVLELDGDKAALEIWIDPRQDGSVHLETYDAVSNFTWLKGPTRVHMQSKHVGIMGQWIDTWRPKNAPPFQKDPQRVESSMFIPRNYNEIGLILEDDLNVSSQAYRWLKTAHKKYNGRHYYAGTSLWSDGVSAHNTRVGMSAPPNQTCFMYVCIGTWGFAPAPKLWAEFQDWFHKMRSGPNATTFHPFVPDTRPNGWYHALLGQGRQDSMWEMWFIYFTHHKKAYTVLNNLAAVNNDQSSCMSINRREIGLHYPSKGPENLCRLLKKWNSSFELMIPDEPIKFDWNGRIVE